MGCAIAIKKGCKNAAEAAEAIGITAGILYPGFCSQTTAKVGIGHGNLRLPCCCEEDGKCFAFLAVTSHSLLPKVLSKLLLKQTEVRKEPALHPERSVGRCDYLRINSFYTIQTQFDYYTGELK